MSDTKKSVAVVTVPDISNYNSERVNYGICSRLTPEFDLTLLGAEQVSERIASSLDTESLVTRTRENKFLQRLLLVPLTFYMVYAYVRREQPDVVASFGNLYVNGLVCVLVSVLSTPVSVVRVTSDFTNLWKYQTGLPATVGCFLKNNIMGRLTVQLADAVIVLGPVMESKLERLGVNGAKIWVIPQPLHIEFAESGRDTDVRSELGIADDVPVVLFVGYFKKSKGPKRLVRTVEYVLERNIDVNFVIVGGSGEYESVVRRKLEGYDRVHFTGWVPHDDLPPYFETADVLLHPSNTEGLPNVVLEALAYELPVVATDSGGEVPIYVSNIGSNYRDLGKMLLHGNLTRDSCPEVVRDPENRYEYQLLFNSLAAG